MTDAYRRVVENTANHFIEIRLRELDDCYVLFQYEDFEAKRVYGCFPKHAKDLAIEEAVRIVNKLKHVP